MKTKSYIIIAIGTILLLAACSPVAELNGSDERVQGSQLTIASVRVEGGVGGAESRVQENADGNSAFEVGDIFCARFANNTKVGTFRIADVAGSCDVIDPINWVSIKSSVVGWYPKEEAIDLSDQSTRMPYVLKATSDVISYGTETTLTFHNRLAKVRVSFEYIGTDEATQDIKDVGIYGYKSCVNAQGDVSVAADAQRDYIAMHKVVYNGKNYWEANLVPGTLQAESALRFSRKGKEETMSLHKDVEIEAGKMSVLSLAIYTSSYSPINLDELTGRTTIDKSTILYGTTNYSISLADGVHVYLCNATINNCIKCKGDATITIVGANVVNCDASNAGISAGPEGTTLTIDGDGKLNVKGGPGYAGIGSGDQSSCGAITIKGGIVTATGGKLVAGIGSGTSHSSCGDITITGGIVTATGGMYGAGIGGGYYKSSCGAITITGGIVTATGGDNGAGIGSGYFESSCGAITINAVSDVRVKSGSSTVCIGNGKFSNSVGDIKVTNCPHVILDNSLGLGYFSPNPKDISGSNFFDEDGSNVTDKITVQ